VGHTAAGHTRRGIDGPGEWTVIFGLPGDGNITESWKPCGRARTRFVLFM